MQQNHLEKRLGDEMETEYLHREPKNDSNDTKQPPVDIGAMMQHLQTALDKIGDLEIEVRSLKTEQGKEGTSGGQQLVHDNIAGRSTTADISSPIRQLTEDKDATKEPRFNTLLTEYWSKIKDEFSIVESHRVESHRQEVGESIANIGEITIHRSASSSDNDISMGGDEESAGRNFLGIPGASEVASIPNVMAKSNDQSSTEASISLIQLKLEELERKHTTSINEQATKIEELESLLVRSKNTNCEPNINGMEHGGHRHSMRSRRLIKFGMTSAALTESGLITSLDEDTFSLMMISRVGSKSWILGCFSFGFQITLGTMIAIGQRGEAKDESLISDVPFYGNIFDVPFKVNSNSVRVAQILSILLSIAMQSDILTSIRSFLLLRGRGSNWFQIIDVAEEGIRPSFGLWAVRIGLPNTMKLSQGLVVTYVSFVIIIQSKDTIDLLKDFTSLMVISEFDNVLYLLASHGYLGNTLRLETERVIDIKVNTEDFRRRKFDHIIFVHLAFFSLLLAMFILWGMVFYLQISGIIFDQKFPGCGKEHYKLAVQEFGDGTCYGGPFNNLNCKYENGDCANFNTAYPNCNFDDTRIDLYNVEVEVTNGECNRTFARLECGFDGDACCPFDIYSSQYFKDGICNGGSFNTAGCMYDSGDCDVFNTMHPDCPLEDLSLVASNTDIILGDGICEGGGYNIEECGFEFGDCDIAQIGVDIMFNGVLSPSSKSAAFDMKMSGDGSKILIDTPRTDKNGNYDANSNGTVAGYIYNSTISKWTTGEAMKRQRNGIFPNPTSIFNGLGISRNGSVVALGSPWRNNIVGGVEVVSGFFGDQPTYGLLKPVSENDYGFGFRLDLAADGLQIAVLSVGESNSQGYQYPGMVQVFERSDHEQEHWTKLGDDIYGSQNLDSIGTGYLQLKKSVVGSRLFISAGGNPGRVLRVYQLNKSDQGWVQLGTDIMCSPERQVDSIAVSADGHRFAISLSTFNPGDVRVYELAPDYSLNEIGPTLLVPKRGGNGFGRSLSMNADGTLLAVSSVDPSCDGQNAAEELCATGSVYLYQFKPSNPPHRPFSLLPVKPRSTMNNEQKREEAGSILGLQISLSEDGLVLAVGGYNFKEDFGFVKVYYTSDLFYMDCIVQNPDDIDNDDCFYYEPYYTEECGWDGGDCPLPSPVEGYDGCKVAFPTYISNGICGRGGSPDGSEECGYEGDDCPRPVAVEGYTDCLVGFPIRIADGICHDFLPYNSYNCGFDGGDCLPPEYAPSPNPLPESS